MGVFLVLQFLVCFAFFQTFVTTNSHWLQSVNIAKFVALGKFIASVQCKSRAFDKAQKSLNYVSDAPSPIPALIGCFPIKGQHIMLSIVYALILISELSTYAGRTASSILELNSSLCSNIGDYFLDRLQEVYRFEGPTYIDVISRRAWVFRLRHG
jgi:hypothetical protein